MLDSSDLVFDLVMSSDKAFEGNLSKEQVANLMLLHKDALGNPNVWRMYCKHYAYHLYNQLHQAIKDWVKSQHIEDADMQVHEDKKNEILRIIHEEADDVLWDCFERLVLSEYKEYVYNCNGKYYLYFGADYHDEMYKYAEFIHMFDVENHIHDPTHFMFVDTDEYEFYENDEKHGHKVLW